MSDELIRKSALFFYLMALSERVALAATAKTIDALQFHLKQSAGASATENANLTTLIRCCLEQWYLLRPTIRKDQVQVVNSSAIQWPEHLDLNPWKEFQKMAPETELLAVVWVHILGVPEDVVASALKVSEGTIRYRVSNGLSLLGKLNRPNIGLLQFT